jgi:hypothetical protein
MESWFWRFPDVGFQDIQIQKLDELYLHIQLLLCKVAEGFIRFTHSFLRLSIPTALNVVVVLLAPSPIVLD